MLKGCLAQGETLEETLEELETVTKLWLETADRKGQTGADSGGRSRFLSRSAVLPYPFALLCRQQTLSY
jgi:hypothetical protein